MIESDGQGGVLIALKVVPGARRDLIVGLLASPGGDRLKVRVSAPPEGGKANAAVGALLAKALGVRKGQVEIVKGATSPEKTACVTGVGLAEARKALGEAGVS